MKENTLLEWAKANREELSRHRLIGTSNTARLLTSVLEIEVEPFDMGQTVAISFCCKILQNEVEKLIFFVDLQSPHGHEHDIQTLIRTATINNIPIALNPATATLIIHEQDAGKE
jgi:methylglyoxal synthase